MRSSKNKLIASSGTKEGIVKVICNYFYDEGCTINETTTPNVWSVHNSKRRIDTVQVTLGRKRYRFEQVV